MNIKNSFQILERQLFEDKIDIIICASGYESRAKNFASKYRNEVSKIPIKYCVGFEFNQSLSRKDNDSVFDELLFEKFISDGDNGNTIGNLLMESIKKNSKNVINIIVDYSSMTRIWYAEIISKLRDCNFKKEINVFFTYSYAVFAMPSKKISPNEHAGPIKGFNNLSIPYKPTALILGLGYEKDRAYGLKEYLDADSFVFYTDEGKGRDYAKIVENANEELLAKTDLNHVFRYPIENLNYTEFQLLSLCNDLKDKYRIILAPCGPKPFTLICLIVSAKTVNTDIDVWRISPGNLVKPIPREANGDMSIYKVEFV